MFKKIILMCTILALSMSSTYSFAGDQEEFQHDAMHMALYETAIIFYEAGKNDDFLEWEEEWFAKWLTSLYPHKENITLVSDLARKYVILNFITYAPELLGLDSKIEREMSLVVKNNSTVITKEFEEDTKKILSSYRGFLKSYPNYLVNRVSLVKKNKEPKANPLHTEPIDFDILMSGITTLAYYTDKKGQWCSGGCLPKRYILNDKVYEGYDALFLKILSLEDSYENQYREIPDFVSMVPFPECLSKIDRVISEIMINDYIEKPVYERTAYTDYNNGLRIRFNDELWKEIDDQDSSQHRSFAIEFISSVCKQKSGVSKYY